MRSVTSLNLGAVCVCVFVPLWLGLGELRDGRGGEKDEQSLHKL